MKIAIVCYPTFGGSGVVATELGIELANRGHEIHFITYRQPVRLALLNSNVHYHEVNVPEYPLFHYQPYELALSSKLVDMVKLHKIELLHVQYAIRHAYSGYMAMQMLKEEGIKIPILPTLFDAFFLIEHFLLLYINICPFILSYNIISDALIT